MIKALTNLKEKYPHIFVNSSKADMVCGEGWYNIIDVTLSMISDSINSKHGVIHITEIKEEDYWIKIHIQPLGLASESVIDEILSYIEFAERISKKVCRITGEWC